MIPRSSKSLLSSVQTLRVALTARTHWGVAECHGRDKVGELSYAAVTCAIRFSPCRASEHTFDVDIPQHLVIVACHIPYKQPSSSLLICEEGSAIQNARIEPLSWQRGRRRFSRALHASGTHQAHMSESKFLPTLSDETNTLRDHSYARTEAK